MTIYVYTGEGAGKTTNAIGLAVRMAGHEKKAVVIQFLKWLQETGEFKIQEKLKPYYRIYQFGRKGWHGLSNLDNEDKKLCENALEFAREITKKEKLDLLVLDEINLAISCRMLSESDVVNYLKSLPPGLDVVLTGRYASPKIIELADVVNEIREIKKPSEMICKKGINY